MLSFSSELVILLALAAPTASQKSSVKTELAVLSCQPEHKRLAYFKEIPSTPVRSFSKKRTKFSGGASMRA